MIILDQKNGLQAIYGGWFLGGGGGGDCEAAQQVLKSALSLGSVRFLEAADVADEACVVTASMVGSPASKETYIIPEHCRRVYELFTQRAGRSADAFITNESGAYSITNGWIIAAATGVPMLDAACNGRAHPTGVMGAMSLDTLPDYRAVQACAAGRGEKYVELCISGSITNTSQAVRQASSMAGGCVTVLRNPALMAHVRSHAALGVVSQCMEIGEWILRYHKEPERLLQKLEQALGMRVLARGVTRDFCLEMKGGFDVGGITVVGDRTVKLDFINEYMTVEENGQRLSTFPELIQLMDQETGLPVCSSALRNGQRVAVIAVPREHLLLGSSMTQRELYRPCEEAIGKEIIPYAFA